MSRSDKPRHGMRCKQWKDSVRASRAQKRAWRKRKQIETQRARTQARDALQKEMLAYASGEAAGLSRQ